MAFSAKKMELLPIGSNLFSWASPTGWSEIDSNIDSNVYGCRKSLPIRRYLDSW